MNINLADLHPDPSNARHIGADEDVAILAASMRRVGLLQPIVVRKNGDGYLVVAGSRRVEAARLLGWSEIEATEFRVEAGENPEDYAVAASAAENMVRTAMHPVDTWRAMSALIDRGHPVEGAAEALGIDMRLARRLLHLGRMASEVLDALAGEPALPQTQYLRLIASAPLDVQAGAVAAAGKLRSKHGPFPWYNVAERCRCARIKRDVAIFDPELMSWDEDLFAEADSDERYTTADVPRFLELQQRALDVRAAASKGRIILGTLDEHGKPIPPVGYSRTWDAVPKRWKKDDPRKVVCGICKAGWNIGEVSEVVVVPKAKPAAATSSDGIETPASVKQRDPITKAVQARLASMKGEALRRALDCATPKMALEALILCFAADNLTVTTGGAGHRVPETMARDLLVTDGTVRQLSAADLAKVALSLVGHIIAFDHPLTNFGTSGDAAKWIGTLVGAEAHMERCDTAEILAGCSGELLVGLARKYGLDDKGKVSEVRQRLVGSLPDWRPVDFGAPAPEVAGGFEEDEPAEDDEDLTPYAGTQGPDVENEPDPEPEDVPAPARKRGNRRSRREAVA